jgi:hypothetical protein
MLLSKKKEFKRTQFECFFRGTCLSVDFFYKGEDYFSSFFLPSSIYLSIYLKNRRRIKLR